MPQGPRPDYWYGPWNTGRYFRIAFMLHYSVNACLLEPGAGN